MALVTEQPKDLPTTNALAGLVETPEPAEIRMSGKTLCVLTDPPALGEDVMLLLKVHIAESCTAEMADGEIKHYLKAKFIAAWKPGDPEPVDTSQGTLWDQAPPEGTFSDGQADSASSD